MELCKEYCNIARILQPNRQAGRAAAGAPPAVRPLLLAVSSALLAHSYRGYNNSAGDRTGTLAELETESCSL